MSLKRLIVPGKVFLALSCVVIVLHPSAANSQRIDAEPARRTGYEAGVRAASAVSVTGRALSGFASGVMLGSIAPVAIYGRNTLALGATAVGIGWLIASARGGSARPPQSLLDNVDPASQSGFIEGYSKRLRGRRNRAALIGGGTGAVVGATTLVAFLVKLSSD
jgi:hypothetical protein